MPKQFAYRGKTMKELEKMSLEEFIKFLPANRKRSMKRGLNQQKKIFLEKIQKAKEKNYTKQIKTHLRDMVVLPNMVGLTVSIHNGREFVPVNIIPEMIGHLLGEFVITRKKVEHSAPGLGATKSSAALAVK